MGITVKQEVYEVLPVGEYPAQIGEIEATEGQFGPQLKFKFELTGDGLADRHVMGWCSQTFTPKSKLYAWTRAAFGRDIPPSYNLDTDHLVGRPVVLVLVSKIGEDGTEYNRIHDVRAVKRNAAPAPGSLTPAAAATTPGGSLAPAAAPSLAPTPPSPASGPVAVNVTQPAPGSEPLPSWLLGEELQF